MSFPCPHFIPPPISRLGPPPGHTRGEALRTKQSGDILQTGWRPCSVAAWPRQIMAFCVTSFLAKLKETISSSYWETREDHVCKVTGSFLSILISVSQKTVFFFFSWLGKKYIFKIKSSVLFISAAWCLLAPT